MAKLGFEKLTEVESPLWPGLVLWVHALAAPRPETAPAAVGDRDYNPPTRGS
jgi:hypothetical protein